jgi:FixJ family two-component response regulator
MSRPGPHSERALILAPQGRDAQIAVMVLRDAGFPAHVCADVQALCDEMEKGAGLAIITDQAIRDVDLRPLTACLGHQAPWSDFPVILLTLREISPERSPVLAKLGEILGNVTFIERPFHASTLTSAVRTAVRGRRRQYEARVRLEELAESESRLQTALAAGNLGSWTLDARDLTMTCSGSCSDRRGGGARARAGAAPAIAEDGDDRPADRRRRA